MNLPADDYILLSWINTQLRDNYSDLSGLCADKDISESEIISRLNSIGYCYKEELNAFKPV